MPPIVARKSPAATLARAHAAGVPPQKIRPEILRASKFFNFEFFEFKKKFYFPVATLARAHAAGRRPQKIVPKTCGCRNF